MVVGGLVDNLDDLCQRSVVKLWEKCFQRVEAIFFKQRVGRFAVAVLVVTNGDLLHLVAALRHGDTQLWQRPFFCVGAIVVARRRLRRLHSLLQIFLRPVLRRQQIAHTLILPIIAVVARNEILQREIENAHVILRLRHADIQRHNRRFLRQQIRRFNLRRRGDDAFLLRQKIHHHDQHAHNRKKHQQYTSDNHGDLLKVLHLLSPHH